MARPTKKGLAYFPFDVDFFEDDKVALIEAEFGEKGILVAIRLLCKIYKNGYYYNWGEDECLLLSRQMGAGFVPSLVKEIVAGLVRRSFFDKGVLDSFGVLTSAGVQQRYIEAIKKRPSAKDCIIDPNYCLLGFIQNKPELIQNKPELIQNKPELIPNKCDKEKKSKENKIKTLSKSPSCESEISRETEGKPLDAAERESIFKIFFFKNFTNPEAELDKFENHYKAVGWVRSGGQRVTDKVALADSWTSKENGQRFEPKFLKMWKNVHSRIAGREGEQEASIMLTDVFAAVFVDSRLTVSVTAELRTFLEAHVSDLAPFFHSSYPNSKLYYKPFNK